MQKPIACLDFLCLNCSIPPLFSGVQRVLVGQRVRVLAVAVEAAQMMRKPVTVFQIKPITQHTLKAKTCQI